MANKYNIKLSYIKDKRRKYFKKKELYKKIQNYKKIQSNN